MIALEKNATIQNHRLLIEDVELPEQATNARVIVLWDNTSTPSRRKPPAELAGLITENEDLLSVSTTDLWGTLR